MAGIVTMRPELADRSDGEANAALDAGAHDVADGRIVFPMAPDQWLRLPSEIDAEACQSGHVTALMQSGPCKKAGLGRAGARERPFDAKTCHHMPTRDCS